MCVCVCVCVCVGVFRLPMYVNWSRYLFSNINVRMGSKLRVFSHMEI